MNKRTFFLPKDDQNIPDQYGVKITFINGMVEELEAASHFVVDGGMGLSVITADDHFKLFPLSNILKIEYDKKYSQLVAIREKQLEDERKKAEAKEKNVNKTV